jgi:predicted metal-dependent peptidase
MNIEDKLEIAQKLQKHHYLFRSFWDIGNPIVGKFEDLDTAAITFNEQGDSLNLLINEEFWQSLNADTRLFLICHEMLHVVLRHGFRFKHYFKTEDFSTMNIAADVVINEMLISGFGFNRYALDTKLANEGCWMNTVFKNDNNIRRDESTEYYFNKLKTNTPLQNLYSIDKHLILTDEQQTNIQKQLEDSGVLDNIDNSFIDNIPKSCKSDVIAGYGLGKNISIKAPFRRKAKWETIIKKWESFYKKEDIHHFERWDRINPRYSHILSDNTHLPSEHRVLDEHLVKDKIDVYFFLDTSGSCINLADRFFKAARSLNPKKFNIRLFCFDTVVKETNIISNNIYGGGGTNFGIIENKIQSIMKTENKKYPHAVWIISDGYGTTVVPEKPEKWYWFLSSDYRNYIPKKSKVYKLSDFE